MIELTIHHSLIDTKSLLAWLNTHYALGELSQCQFIRMGLNDTYWVKSALKSYIVRIYRAAWRSRDAILAELEVLSWLQARGFPVAGVVRTKNGQTNHPFMAPEGLRTLVVFDYVEGQALALDERTAKIYGQALARLHNVTDAFTFHSLRFCLNEAHLIDEPLRHIERAFGHHEKEVSHLKDLAIDAKKVFAALPKTAPMYGFCHGDHFGNVLCTSTGELVFIDFDCCGMGLRVYDVVQFWWAIRLRMGAWRETFLCDNDALWQAFLAGYESLRALTELEYQAMDALLVIRTLWGLGLQPQNEQHWGIEQHEAIWQQNYALLSV